MVSVVDSVIGMWVFFVFIFLTDEHSCLTTGFMFILLMTPDSRNVDAYFLFVYYFC